MSKSTTKPKRHKIRAHMVVIPRARSASNAGDAIFTSHLGAVNGAGAIAAPVGSVDFVSAKPVDRGPLPDSHFLLLLREGKLPIEQIVSARLAVRRFVRMVEACGQRVPVRFAPNF